MFTAKWISRLAALSLLVVVLAAIYSFVVEPTITAYAGADQAIAEANEQLEHFERLAATRPALSEQMAELKQRQASQGFYLSGGTDALAAAALQDRLKSVIEGNGGTVRSIQPLAGVDEQGFRRVTVRVQFTASTESMFRTVYALEAGTPLVFIEGLEIQSRIPRPSRDSVGEPSPEPVLTAGFNLYGYLPVEAK
jgi:general secretion pathway protein M